MDSSIDFKDKLIKEEAKGAQLSNSFLIIIQTMSLLIFIYYKVYGMIILDLASLVTCTITMYILKKKKIGLFTSVVYIGIFLYSFIATILVGKDFGFNYYIICLIPLIFYSDYISKIRNKINIDSNFYSLIAVIFYFAGIFITNIIPPVYSGIPNEVSFVIYIINIVCTLCYIFVYLNRFTRVVNAMEEKLSNKAEFDELTKLYNRHKTTELLNNAYNDFKVSKNEKWVSIIDIDNFKKINDLYGHNCGDYVLRELANILKKNAYRKNYNVSRWGGEEFLIFGDLNEETFELIESLRKTIEQYDFNYKQNSLSITITAGVSVIDENSTINSWIDKADSNLYVGKKGTKNCVVYDG